LMVNTEKNMNLVQIISQNQSQLLYRLHHRRVIGMMN